MFGIFICTFASAEAVIDDDELKEACGIFEAGVLEEEEAAEIFGVLEEEAAEIFGVLEEVAREIFDVLEEARDGYFRIIFDDDEPVEVATCSSSSLKSGITR